MVQVQMTVKSAKDSKMYYNQMKYGSYVLISFTNLQNCAFWKIQQNLHDK